MKQHTLTQNKEKTPIYSHLPKNNLFNERQEQQKQQQQREHIKLARTHLRRNKRERKKRVKKLAKCQSTEHPNQNVQPGREATKKSNFKRMWNKSDDDDEV